MEPASWLLILSLMFGGWNYVEKEKAQDEVVKLKAEVAAYRVTLDDLERVIEENDTVLVSLEQSSEDCKNRYLDLLGRVNSFNEVSRAKDVAIQNLQDKLIGTSFAECRVPDGISLDGW